MTDRPRHKQAQERFLSTEIPGINDENNDDIMMAALALSYTLENQPADCDFTEQQLFVWESALAELTAARTETFTTDQSIDLCQRLENADLNTDIATFKTITELLENLDSDPDQEPVPGLNPN